MKDSVLASTYFPVRTSVGGIYAGNEVMSEYSKFMGYLGDYYQITPGWTTARTEWWNMLQRVGSGEAVETAVKTFVDNANAAAAAEAPKAEEKKAAPAKKAPAKKAAVKTSETVFIEFAGGQIEIASIVEKVKESLAGKAVKDLKVYYQPEKSVAYYTADGESGSVNL